MNNGKMDKSINEHIKRGFNIIHIQSSGESLFYPTIVYQVSTVNQILLSF